MGKKPYKHLTIEHRRAIECGLNNQESLSSMARKIGVDASTVRREILRNRRDDGFTRSKNGWRNAATSVILSTRSGANAPSIRRVAPKPPQAAQGPAKNLATTSVILSEAKNLATTSWVPPAGRGECAEHAP